MSKPLPLGPGGCTPSAECNEVSLCRNASQLFKCCIYLSTCWTEVIGLMSKADQTIDVATPQAAIFHGVRIPGVGFMAIGDSLFFKAGEIVAEIDGLPAYQSDTWEAWRKKGQGDSVFTVLDLSHAITTRTITRL